MERPKNVHIHRTPLDRYGHFLRTITDPIGMHNKLLAAFSFDIRRATFVILIPRESLEKGINFYGGSHY